MFSAGIILIVLWAILKVLGFAVEVLFKLGLVVLVVGLVADFLTGFRVFRR